MTVHTLNHFRVCTTGQAELRGIQGQSDRLARRPLVSGATLADLQSLPALKQYLGRFLPDPQVIQALVNGKVENMISIQNIGTDGRGKTPRSLLEGKKEKGVTLADIDEFVEGCRQLQAQGSVLPDLAGVGNLGTWNDRPLLLELSTGYNRREEATNARGRVIRVPVNEEGVPVWDESLSVLGWIQTALLDQNIQADNFYEALRDDDRQALVNELWRRHKEKQDLAKMC